MKRASTTFLQTIILLLTLAALTFLLWEPHLEGRNVHATPFQIYFHDRFLAYVYLASIPFFVALYQAFKLLGHAARNDIFSHDAVQSLRTIKYCAIALLVFVALSLLFMTRADPDDRPAGLFLRILVAFPSLVVATAAAIFERILQNAVDLKSENDLTV